MPAPLALAALLASCSRPAVAPAPVGQPDPAEPAAVPATSTAALPPPAGSPAALAAIRADPSAWAGRTVEVEGTCLGWRCQDVGSGPPATRSDVCFTDGTGAIYASGAPIDGRCTGRSGAGTPVRFRGLVRLDDAGIPWIDARTPSGG